MTRTLLQLSKRFEKRAEAKEDNEEAKETGTVEEMDKFSRRTVKVTREHNEECRRLLKLMGIPVVVVRCIILIKSLNLTYALRHLLKPKLNVRNWLVEGRWVPY